MKLEQWIRANSELIARSLAELLYEEILILKTDSDGMFVELKSGITYRFEGKKGLWDFYQIDPKSVRRLPETPGEHLEASLFFRDANSDLGMSNITLSHFLEEMHNTLYSEMQIMQNKSEIKTSDLTQKSGEELQAYLSGHPKILLNKGRLGFASLDLYKYAPEHKGSFQVMWLAVRKHSFIEAFSEGHEFYFTQKLFKAQELSAIKMELERHDALMSEYALFPVHPWQFERFLQVQFQKEILNHTIIPLTTAGPFYRPQTSIRTLSNTSNANECDLKLSLTILNTSAYRGISPENIQIGPELSEYMENICTGDPLLKEMKTEVLKEVYVASFCHPVYSQVEGAPYRYNEFLGCVVRESATSKLTNNELAVMTGSLFYVGDDGASLIGEYIKLSGISPEKWLKKYFQHVVIPLYHLQLAYGIGIVSHGQNIVLRLKDYAPSGMFIKDFQGDLRLSEEFAESFPKNMRTLKTLPSSHLIHDLITGHFITVLRFISPVMEKCSLLKESDFYQILGVEIERYLQAYHPEISHDSPLSLLRPSFEKVILNKVRFKIGYEDSSARPLPLLGKNLANPLVSKNEGLHEL